METGEPTLRQQVAACTLLLNDLGILGYSGHVSVRLPGRDAFLIQPVDQSRAALAPEHLMVCDFDGKTLAGPAGLKPPSERFIHSEILRARSDVNAVAHFHHDIGTIFTLVEGARLTPIKNHAVRWASGIPVHPDPSHVSSPALGRAVAATLGPHHALLIRAHGQVVAAESVPALLIDSVHFVENAETMYRAAALGRAIPLSAEEIAAFLSDFDRPSHVAKLWKYYVGIGRARRLLPEAWQL
ncbi:MAG TPA: class II aldolase/adducin family protein [Stellaceae bacterium]|nr:class II aldolase/adducin family protein [Stellaceae bacterium]